MKKKRLQIDLSEESFARLEALKEKSEASSYGEVTSKAFKLYEFLIDALNEEKKIFMTDANGKSVEVTFI